MKKAPLLWFHVNRTARAKSLPDYRSNNILFKYNVLQLLLAKAAHAFLFFMVLGVSGVFHNGALQKMWISRVAHKIINELQEGRRLRTRLMAVITRKTSVLIRNDVKIKN